MKWLFAAAAFAAPVSLWMDQAASGLMLSMIFMLAGAYFSKPRVQKRTEDSKDNFPLKKGIFF